jgi:hypothetical protein
MMSVNKTMRFESREDFERARERLRRRGAESLASFLMTLAGEGGPIGDQVRTFIVGDALSETVESLKVRIGALSTSSDYEHRHSHGQEIGESLNFIVDSIERLVLPTDANAAFELLAALFEADAVAMENCGEHDWQVACAYERAAGVLVQAAQNLPRAPIEERIKKLVEEDQYGVRGLLKSAFLETKAPT